MDISSSINTLSQQAIFNTNKTEGKVEGNKPDADNDKDDAVKVANTVNATNPTTPVNSAPPMLGAVGNNINLTA
ncbi:hypothetical protein [Thiomicrorhabdus arctica]|uniref:hypothetical protein n=1 Tax=Thiomicrorhabdus arctica TaxID=131540 RepID=UPI00038084D2|nr:hypothetical protein [Thiomicrorhabdus arctica]